MGQILGLGTTDYPRLRAADGFMTAPFKGTLNSGHRSPEAQNPRNWPKPMQEEWANDEGLEVGKVKRDRAAAQFKVIETALDEFKPDLILLWAKDNRESLKTAAIPQWWIQANEQFQVKLYTPFGSGESYFGPGLAEEVVTIPGHQPAALYLANGLQKEGFDVTYSLETSHANGLAHTHAGVVTHLDWHKRTFKTPIVPVSVDMFAFMRERNAGGLSPWDQSMPGPITPQRAFELGRATARVFQASPWRVALVAGTSWSHTNNTDWTKEWVHPDHDADLKRHEQWKNNQFSNWGSDWTFEEMEEHAQWEHLCWIMLAGAMTEIGAKVVHSDIEFNYVYNDNWVNTVFSVK
jgi:hypothetical protein